jgi:hypothetical protein
MIDIKKIETENRFLYSNVVLTVQYAIIVTKREVFQELNYFIKFKTNYGNPQLFYKSCTKIFEREKCSGQN